MMTRWVNDKRATIIRFEDIVGPRGNGLFSDQLATALNFCSVLDVNINIADLTRALAGSFQPGIALFRRGQIGSWKEEMAPNTAEQVRLMYPWAFEPWGYELDGSLTHHANERADILSKLDAAAAALVDENAHLRAKVNRLASFDSQQGPVTDDVAEAAADGELRHAQPDPRAKPGPEARTSERKASRRTVKRRTKVPQHSSPT